MCIRNSAKALVLKNDMILVNKCHNSTGYSIGEINISEIYYDLPGGGQKKYETIEETLKRECLEETGYHIETDRLVGILEEIYMSGKLQKQYSNYVHKIYFVFLCHVVDKDIKTVIEKDIDQIECEWINIKEISNINLYPKTIKTNLQNMLNTQKPIFLGSKRI